MTLPEGCQIRKLTTHADARGELTEIFRQEWRLGIDPVQWNFVASRANVLRGVHVHVVHTDYLVCLQGTMILGLVDIRPESPSHGLAATVELTGADLRAAFIPPGVAHGFFFPEVSTLCYSVSHYWNTERDRLPLGRPEARPGLAAPKSRAFRPGPVGRQRGGNDGTISLGTQRDAPRTWLTARMSDLSDAAAGAGLF